MGIRGGGGGVDSEYIYHNKAAADPGPLPGLWSHWGYHSLSLFCPILFFIPLHLPQQNYYFWQTALFIYFKLI